MSDLAASGWLEKHRGAGEDARPIAEASGAWLLIGVFDGMGAAGAKIYTRRSDGRQATGAAFASEAVAAAARAAFAQFARADEPASAFEAHLERAMRRALEALPGEVESQSRVAGTLMLEFPTTACLLLLRRGESKGLALWVGDSLGFTWSGQAGLRLLTWSGESAAQSFARLFRADGLWADNANTMAVSADQRRPWGFTTAAFDLAGADLVLVASDGAYAAFDGPTGLERALVDAIAKSSCLDAASLALSEAIAPIMQDDVSFALLNPNGDWARVASAAAARRAVAASAVLTADFLHGAGGKAPERPAPRPPTAPPRPAPHKALPAQAVKPREDRMNKTLGMTGWILAVLASAVSIFAFMQAGAERARLNAEIELLTCRVTEAHVRLRLERASALTPECAALLEENDANP